jgi:pyruvate ferredoxin oxidoreductase beta subunit
MATRLTLRALSHKEDRLSPGHRLCAGCAEPIIVRQILLALDSDVVIGEATGCLEVATTIYPYSAWRVPWIHNAFENAAATVSGIETAYRSLVKQGKKEPEDVQFLAFAGDGGTYDIGLQSLSGAMERGHNLMYVCFDNGAYMNTGIQRSSATPFGAHTTTSPAGSVVPGKLQFRKPLTEIMAAHNIPYAAQASPWRWRDLMEKARKGAAVDGPAFLNVLASCPRGWRHPTDQSIEISGIATDACWWPLFEVNEGEWKLNYKPRQKRPITDWLEAQGRFRHLLRPENQHLVEKIQAEVDRRWNALLVRCGEA